MNWKFAGVLVCVLSVFGCNNNVERPASTQRSGGVTVELPRGEVMIQNAVRNLEEKYVTADVVGEGIDYTFRLDAIEDAGGSTTGGVAELRDESGKLLFSITSQTNKDTGEVVFTQATPEDYLTNSIVGDDETVREYYDANGDVASFEYPALPDDTQRRAVNAYRHGVNPRLLPERVAGYIAQVGAFDAYYAPHATSTLHNNPDGELLARILASSQLEGVIGGVMQPAKIIGVPNVCQAARACQTLVCYTHPSSLLCFACTVVSVACAIMDIICNWFGC